MAIVWFSIVILSAPVLVFAAKPASSFNWRFGRLILASLIGYVFLNLANYTSNEQHWQAHIDCCTEKGLIDQCENPIYNTPARACPSAPNSKSVGFLRILGWVFTAGYAGFWEFFWRLYYRKSIRSMTPSLKGKWFSTLFAGWGLFLFVISPVCSMIGVGVAVLLNDIKH